MHQYMLVAIQLENSFEEKALMVLVDIKLNISQQCDLAEKRIINLLGFIKQNTASRPFPSARPWQGTSGALCLVLESLVQKTQTYWGETSKVP